MRSASILHVTFLVFGLWTSGHADKAACVSQQGEKHAACRSHNEEVVSLMQVSNRIHESRQSTKETSQRQDNDPMKSIKYEIETEKTQQRIAGLKGPLDEHPNEMYNWGVKWGDWYDDLMHMFPPEDGLYEILNYGLSSEKLHACAAKVKAGRPGYTLPFNYTTGANMYQELISKSPVKLKGAKVLDLASGRGGGTAFISDCYCPAQIMGLELSPKQIKHAQSRYGRMEGSCPVKYVEGNAMDLPFENNTFDVVLNIQSSFEFPSYRKFAEEVQRVLRPGGALLHADLRFLKDSQTDTAVLEDVFRKPVEPVDVSQQVLRSFNENQFSGPFEAMCLVKYRKAHGVALTEQDGEQVTSVEHGEKKGSPWHPHKHGIGVKNPLGCAEMSGSLIAEGLHSGSMNYRMYVLQK